MKKGFVHTENFKRLTEAQKLVGRRGAREAGLVIIQGPYGVGKSELCERWAIDNGAVFVRCKKTWTTRALLDELADKMGLSKSGRNQEVQARIIGKLAVSMVPLMLDEADHLISTSTATLLEVVRDITDMTGTMCFLVGMEKFGYSVARHPHIASRVAKVVEFQPISLADVRAAIEAKAALGDAPDSPKLPMDDGAIAVIAEQSQGRMRLLLNAIANIEQWAQANGWKKVSAAELKGRQLCVEFNGKTLGRARSTEAA
jgi:DNA transposition AAA+ family ATPase